MVPIEASISVQGKRRKTHLQALGGTQETTTEPLPPPPPLDGWGKICTGHIEREALHWLECCIVGTSKNYKEPEVISQQIKESGIQGLTIRRLSGLQRLISFHDRKALDEAKQANWNGLFQWFENLVEWAPSMGMKTRHFWVSVSGIPVHAWNWVTFPRIGSLWGSLICLGDENLKLQSFERATMLIYTESLTKIEESFRLAIGNQVFTAYAREFSPDCMLDFPGWSRWQDGPSDCSSSSVSSEVGGLDMAAASILI